jgi:murein L,D-transpeptidase YcbB/YkuD
MPESWSFIRRAARGVTAALAIVACGSAWGQAAGAQDVDEALRARVEELAATGSLEVDGEPIAARQLIPRLYERRAFAPAWRSVAQIDSLLEMIDESPLEGLDPRDYHVEAVRAARAALADGARLEPAERAKLDILLTDSVIRLGYHLRFGKVDPVALDPHWNLSRELMGEDPVLTIQAAIDSASMRDFAAEVIPRVFLYERIKNALAEYRAIAAAGGWTAVAPGSVLKSGVSDARVAALAARLAVTGDLDASRVDAVAAVYDDELASAVRRFQQRHGLATDGAVGPQTLAALNVPVEARIDQLRANLERARWVLYDPQSEFLVVNIAGFRMYLVRRGEIAWSTRVVVGQPFRRTPVFSSTMRYLVFNPTWTVPPTVLARDILPEVRRDPGYLATRNIDVFDAANALVDPASVDWSSRRSFPYRFVQRPGATNALGRVKFMFPNDYAVYLHDTPSRDLFERDSRAFSSGCIRVEDPLELAELLLGSGWDRQRMQALIATGRTETVFLDEPVPVMLLYCTAEVDSQGRVSFFPDVYGRDAAVIGALAEPFDARVAL